MNFAIPLLHPAAAFLAETAGELAGKAAEGVETTAEAASGFGGLDLIGPSVGLGLVCIAAAWGIGGIAKAAVESIARQPEASADIRGATILTAAFIEGVCLFAVTVLLIKGGIGL